MCTVTFLPAADRFYITSNRDESPSRQAKGLYSNHHLGFFPIHYPLDESSQGSWIALSESGRAVCLLNGAFDPFVPAPSYRLSRGQVVMAAAREDRIQEFIDHFAFDGIAPFTLLVFEAEMFVELVWDGFKKHICDLNPDQPQLWSSVTLYPPDVRAWRRSIFKSWLQDHPVFDQESIIAFHQMKPGDGHNDFIMNRNEVVKTLSVTSIVMKPTSGRMLHLDLEKNIREEVLIRYGE